METSIPVGRQGAKARLGGKGRARGGASERARERAHSEREGSEPQAAEPNHAWAAAVSEPNALRVAVLDEDRGFLVVLSKRLERLGWTQHNLAPAVPVRRLASMPIDVLVVDMAVLGARSWSWLERLFQTSPDFRVIVCTSSSTVNERVRGLQMGADDWLTKPCHTEELVARIESVVGRRRLAEPHQASRSTSARSKFVATATRPTWPGAVSSSLGASSK